MSTHPNVILMAVLKPDGLSRKTMRDILAESEKKYKSRDEVKIGDSAYNPIVMESDYDEDYQISADVGDLVFFDMVTYGYGETVKWDDLEKRKSELELWAKKASKQHHCGYNIFVTANYW